MSLYLSKVLWEMVAIATQTLTGKLDFKLTNTERYNTLSVQIFANCANFAQIREIKSSRNIWKA